MDYTLRSRVEDARESARTALERYQKRPTQAHAEAYAEANLAHSLLQIAYKAQCQAVRERAKVNDALWAGQD